MFTAEDLTHRKLTEKFPFIFTIEEIYDWFPALIEVDKIHPLYWYTGFVEDKETVILAIAYTQEVEVYWTPGHGSSNLTMIGLREDEFAGSTHFIRTMSIDGQDYTKAAPSKIRITIPPEYGYTIQYIKANVKHLYHR